VVDADRLHGNINDIVEFESANWSAIDDVDVDMVVDVEILVIGVVVAHWESPVVHHPDFGWIISAADAGGGQSIDDPVVMISISNALAQNLGISSCELGLAQTLGVCVLLHAESVWAVGSVVDCVGVFVAAAGDGLRG